MTTARGSEAAQGGGAVGWGLVELSKLRTTPRGESFNTSTCPQFSWKISKFTNAPSSQDSPIALQLQPCWLLPQPTRCVRAARGFSHPSRWTPSRYSSPGCPRDYPLIPTSRSSQSFLPSPAPCLHPSILPDFHLFEVPACPGSLYSTSPSLRPHLNSH